MGYLRKALNKLFINNKEKSEKEKEISGLKVGVMLFGLACVGIFEVAGIREEKIYGHTEVKPSAIIEELFNKEKNVEFVNNNKACKEKYVTEIVENHSNFDRIPTELWTESCKIRKPIFSREAIEQFHSLKNKNKFRVRYVQNNNYQKIYSVADYGVEGFREIVTKLNTYDVKNKCVQVGYDKVCNIPKLPDGIYEAAFLVDADKNVIQTNYINKIH